MPHARAEFSVATVADEVLLIGGVEVNSSKHASFTDGGDDHPRQYQRPSTILHYSTREDKWTEQQAPEGLPHAAASVVMGTDIYKLYTAKPVRPPNG